MTIHSTPSNFLKDLNVSFKMKTMEKKRSWGICSLFLNTLEVEGHVGALK
jgi:hypothetical protein